jgi:hypothetical protein
VGESREVASAAVIIRLRPDEATVSLVEPDVFTQFSLHVSGEGDADAVASVVGSTGLGRLQPDGQHVAVDPRALRALAGTVVDEEWESGFQAMCAYAAGKGWVEADGAILAHIEWGTA